MCQTCGSPLLNINFELITFLNLKKLQIFTITEFPGVEQRLIVLIHFS